MPSPVSSLRNLGEASNASYARAGIHSAEQLRDLGADAAYSMLLRSGSRPHFIAYYAMVMGLQGRPWNDVQGAEKAALRVRFDRIKREAFDSDLSAFEKVLDEIGVRPVNPCK
jgi:hypothetical protein